MNPQFHQWSTKTETETSLKSCRISRVPTLLLRNNSRTFQDTQNVFPGCSILHVRYWTYFMWCHPWPTCLTKCTVYKDAIPRCIMYGNINYFVMYCHFVSISKSPNLALCMSSNLNHNFKSSRTFQDLHFNSRTNLIFQDFPGPWNFRKINQGLSRIRGTLDITLYLLLRQRQN